jgi:hypothetical protein
VKFNFASSNTIKKISDILEKFAIGSLLLGVYQANLKAILFGIAFVIASLGFVLYSDLMGR